MIRPDGIGRGRTGWRRLRMAVLTVAALAAALGFEGANAINSCLSPTGNYSLAAYTVVETDLSIATFKVSAECAAGHAGVAAVQACDTDGEEYVLSGCDELFSLIFVDESRVAENFLSGDVVIRSAYDPDPTDRYYIYTSPTARPYLDPYSSSSEGRDELGWAWAWEKLVTIEISKTVPDDALYLLLVRTSTTSGSETVLASVLTRDRYPQLHAVSPESGSTLGGQTVTLTGEYIGFIADDVGLISVTVGGFPCYDVSWINSQTITVEMPFMSEDFGGWNDVVVTVDGLSSRETVRFYYNVSTIIDILPPAVNTAYESTVTIYGSYLSAQSNSIPACELAAPGKFDLVTSSSDIISITVASFNDTAINATVPPMPPGSYELRCSLDSGTSFHYGVPEPVYLEYYEGYTITDVAPPYGPRKGNTMVFVRGSGFDGSTHESGKVYCRFGDRITEAVEFAEAYIKCRTPEQDASGPYQVQVSINGGLDEEDWGTANASFYYLEYPTFLSSTMEISSVAGLEYVQFEAVLNGLHDIEFSESLFFRFGEDAHVTPANSSFDYEDLGYAGLNVPYELTRTYFQYRRATTFMQRSDGNLSLGCFNPPHPSGTVDIAFSWDSQNFELTGLQLTYECEGYQDRLSCISNLGCGWCGRLLSEDNEEGVCVSVDPNDQDNYVSAMQQSRQTEFEPSPASCSYGNAWEFVEPIYTEFPRFERKNNILAYKARRHFMLFFSSTQKRSRIYIFGHPTEAYNPRMEASFNTDSYSLFDKTFVCREICEILEPYVSSPAFTIHQPTLPTLASVDVTSSSVTLEHRWDALDTSLSTIEVQQSTSSDFSTYEVVATPNTTNVNMTFISYLENATTYYHRVFVRNMRGEAVSDVLAATTGLIVTPVLSVLDCRPAVLGYALNSQVAGTVPFACFFDAHGQSLDTLQLHYAETGNTDEAEVLNVGFPQSATFRVVTGLLPDKSYDFRLVATNAEGTIEGAYASFSSGPLEPRLRVYSDDNVDLSALISTRYENITYNATTTDPSVTYRGCYSHDVWANLGDAESYRVGDDPVSSAITYYSVSECLSFAEAANATFYGMEYPEGSSVVGNAQCFVYPNAMPWANLSTYMVPTADSNCEAEVDLAGNRLGSGYIQAIYYVEGVEERQTTEATIIPPNTTFGQVPLLRDEDVLVFMLRNEGTAELTISDVEIQDDVTGSFYIGSQPFGRIPPGHAAYLDVGCSPTAMDNVTATLIIRGNMVSGEVQFALHAEGIEREAISHLSGLSAVRYTDVNIVDAQLGTATVSRTLGLVLTPEFDPEVTSYLSRAAYDAANFECLFFVASSRGEAVINHTIGNPSGPSTEETGSNFVTLSIGQNVIEVSGIAEDRSETVYRLNVERFDKEFLFDVDLVQPGITLQPDFDPHVQSYTIDVLHSTSTVDLRAFMSAAASTLTYNSGVYTDDPDQGPSSERGAGASVVRTVTLDTSADGTHVLTVDPGDGGGARDYTFTVVKASSASTESGIASLEVTLGKFILRTGGAGLFTDFIEMNDPQVNRTNQTEFLVESYSTTTAVQVRVTASGVGTTVTVAGQAAVLQADSGGLEFIAEVEVTAGGDVVNVVVTAEDGSSTSYDVILDGSVSSGSSGRLASLDMSAVLDVYLTKAFDPDDTEFYAAVEWGVTIVTITVIPEDGDAVVSINSQEVGRGESRTVMLLAGQNPIPIDVAAGDGTVRSHVLTIDRLGYSSASKYAHGLARDRNSKVDGYFNKNSPAGQSSYSKLTDTSDGDDVSFINVDTDDVECVNGVGCDVWHFSLQGMDINRFIASDLRGRNSRFDRMSYSTFDLLIIPELSTDSFNESSVQMVGGQQQIDTTSSSGANYITLLVSTLNLPVELRGNAAPQKAAIHGSVPVFLGDGLFEIRFNFKMYGPSLCVAPHYRYLHDPGQLFPLDADTALDPLSLENEMRIRNANGGILDEDPLYRTMLGYTALDADQCNDATTVSDDSTLSSRIGGEGFAIVIHNTPNGTSAVGCPGTGLGYTTDDRLGCTAHFNKAVAIEFLTYFNVTEEQVNQRADNANYSRTYRVQDRNVIRIYELGVNSTKRPDTPLVSFQSPENRFVIDDGSLHEMRMVYSDEELCLYYSSLPIFSTLNVKWDLLFCTPFSTLPDVFDDGAAFVSMTGSTGIGTQTLELYKIESCAVLGCGGADVK